MTRLSAKLWLISILMLSSGNAVVAQNFQNPILAGFHADPSICRVGEDYYLACSSFEYFPGVPIYHSKDLVSWKLIGHCLTRKSQLPLEKMRASGGIFAPTLRHHDGTFYMITTNVWGGGNFYVTATEPDGRWSEPVWLDQEGIDPSLFFDDDGKVYYCRHVGGEDGYIGLTTLNLSAGKLEGELKNIWGGTGGVWAEGPHLYKVAGKYYLMISEGGTSYNHSVTIARSDSPWGPYVPCPDNPILTHRNEPERPIQAVGHADLVKSPDGWWMVCLGIRPQGGPFHHIGRETFLAPLKWNDMGWAVVNNNQGIEEEMTAPSLPVHTWEHPSERDEFEEPSMAVHWNYLRNPVEGNYSLTARPGFLRLFGTKVKLTEVDSPTFVARKQTGLSCQVSASLDFNPQTEGEEAGLVVRGNDENHYIVGLTWHEGKRQGFCRRVLKGKTNQAVKYVPLPNGPVDLAIVAFPDRYEMIVPYGKPGQLFESYNAQDLSTEKIGGFTGVYIGMYAMSEKANPSPADFNWFNYSVIEK